MLNLIQNKKRKYPYKIIINTNKNAVIESPLFSLGNFPKLIPVDFKKLMYNRVTKIIKTEKIGEAYIV